MELASPAPITPNGWPVPKPITSMGARIAFTSTVPDCSIIGMPTTPEARKADPSAALGNMVASAGR